MFCIDNRCTDIYFNLAAEEYLLKQKRGNFFMLWQSEPSVVIGKHQSVAAEADERFLDEKGITLARRFSGGGAVYHDRGNINLSFIETVKQPDFVYYLQQVVDFLEKVGISAYADQNVQECPRHSCCEMHVMQCMTYSSVHLCKSTLSLFLPVISVHCLVSSVLNH